jgi:hypothetical protein
MKLLKNLLVLIAATGVIGSAQAQTPGNTFDLGTLSPTVTTTTDAFASGSFLDTFNFMVDATHYMVTGTTDSTNVGNLQLGLYDSTGTLLYTGLNFHTDLNPGSYYAQISGDVLTSPGQFSFSVAANPEPAEWMLLLCGLVVAGFIARRKMELVAG